MSFVGCVGGTYAESSTCRDPSICIFRGSKDAAREKFSKQHSENGGRRAAEKKVK